MMSTINQTNTVRFMIKRVNYYNPETGFGACQVIFKNYDRSFTPPVSTLILTGIFPASPMIDDSYETDGNWVDTSKHGWTFQAGAIKIVLPSTELGIKKFLKKIVGGVGEKKASEIVKVFGTDTIQVIARDPKALMSIKGIGQKKSEEIHLRILERTGFTEFALAVLRAGGTMSTAVRAFHKYGKSALDYLKSNPYALTDIEGFGFKTADNIAFRNGMKADSLQRLNASIRAFLEDAATRHGHMFVYERELFDGLTRFLDKKGVFPSKRIDETKVKQVIEDSSSFVVVYTDEQELIYLNRLNSIENKLAKSFSQVISRELPPIGDMQELEHFLCDYKVKTGMALANQQVKAVQMVSDAPFSILTGGPGTGKTQTVNAVLMYFEMVNPSIDIELAAPTGKAARRLSEMTGRDAQTLHRLIGLKGEDMKGDDTMMVTADILVIDEASMVDAYVFGRVMDSLSSHTRLLIVGDHEQLPSVGPGLVLRDLIGSNVIPVTRLTEVFRQAAGSLIITNAHAIAKGDEIQLKGKELDFHHIERVDLQKVQGTILASIERLILKGDHTLDDIQVLSPTRNSVLGTDVLNGLIQKQFNPESSEKAQHKVTPTTVLRVGDRVIQNRNDYELNVMNGEVGKLESIYQHEDRGMLFTVAFEDGRKVEYDKRSIEDLGLAYALTIHKSQGSEFPVVLMPVHSSLDFILSKNLIYTGLTRARAMVVLFGEIETLREMAKIEKGTKRNSRLIEKIRWQMQRLVV